MKTLSFPLGPIFDDYGHIAPGAILVGYEPDSDNLKQWFFDAELQTLAPNPVQAASDGRVPQIFLGEGKYRIRQYVPSSPTAVIPDDMADFPVGDDWQFVCEWLCEGETLEAGTKYLAVDRYNDLGLYGEEDAAWILVRNYETTGDCVPRWFYYSPAGSLIDNQGSVHGAIDGGHWVLAISKGEYLDARIFGLSPDADDNTSAFTQAAEYAYDNGMAGLYVPSGTYTFDSNAIIPVRVPIRLGQSNDSTGVKVIVTAGKVVEWDILKDYEIPQTMPVAFNTSTEFYLNFASCSVSKTAQSYWNGLRAGSFDLSDFNGQSVVLSLNGGAEYFSNSGGVDLKAVYVAEDVEIKADSAFSLHIGSISSTGGKLTANTAGSCISVDTAYASALASGDDTTDLIIGRLVVDADLAYSGSASFDVAEFAGGLLEGLTLTIGSIIANGPHPFFKGPTRVNCDGTQLEASMFSALNYKALDSLSTNPWNNYDVDLQGRTASLIGGYVPSYVKTLRNGSVESEVSGDSIRIGNDFAAFNVSFAEKVEVSANKKASFSKCSFANGVLLGSGADCYAEDSIFENWEDPDHPDGNYDYSLSNDGGAAVAKWCTFNGPVKLHLPTKAIFEHNTSTANHGTGASKKCALFFVNGSIPSGTIVRDNYPDPISPDSTDTWWPRTEGDIVVKDTTASHDLTFGAADPTGSVKSVLTKWAVIGLNDLHASWDWDYSIVANAINLSTSNPKEVIGMLADEDTGQGVHGYPRELAVVFNSGDGGLSVRCHIHFKVVVP